MAAIADLSGMDLNSTLDIDDTTVPFVTVYLLILAV